MNLLRQTGKTTKDQSTRIFYYTKFVKCTIFAPRSLSSFFLVFLKIVQNTPFICVGAQEQKAVSQKLLNLTAAPSDTALCASGTLFWHFCDGLLDGMINGTHDEKSIHFQRIQ